MKVELLDFMGHDLAVVNAARVSFDKESEWEELQDDEGFFYDKLSEKDTKLIDYLSEHKHWTPFAHQFIKFRVTIPIYVARQLAKHQVGGVVNEVSRRYVSFTPVLDVPTKWRKTAENVKQGSSEELIVVNQHLVNREMEACLNLYDYLISIGVCPEQARAVLPICCETTWIWSGSLAFFARVCNLRLDPHAQKETRLVAEEIDKLIEPLFPIAWAALMGKPL
jgi:thymidylate synthase (FAD)